MIYLVRDFSEKKIDKLNQELIFNDFSDKDLLLKINDFFEVDNWKRKNIKSLAIFLKSITFDDDLFLHYKKWNFNIEYLYKELVLTVKEYTLKFNDEILIKLENKNILSSYNQFKNLSEEEKFGTITKLILKYNQFKLFNNLNDALNNNYFSLVQIFNLFIFNVFGEKIDG